MVAPKLLFMAYKVEKGKENARVSALISDGNRLFKGVLGDASQVELEELHALGVPHIINDGKKKRKRKTRDNEPLKPIPQPPLNEPKENDNKGDAEA